MYCHPAFESCLVGELQGIRNRNLPWAGGSLTAETRKRKAHGILGEQVARLRRVLEATKTLNSTLDLAGLTEIILQIIRQEVPVDRVTAFMVDRTSGTLRSLVAQDVGDFVIRLPMGVGVAGFVAQTGEILDIPDAYNDTRFYPAVDRLLGYHTQDIFCMPILNRDREIVGVLELLNRARPIDITDRRFLNEISVHIGMALELAWSHREIVDKQSQEVELKRLRERLVELDRVELVGELVTSVMHELNNPLAILVGNVDLLKTQLKASELQPEANRYVEKIEMAADRSAATVRKYLHFIATPPRQRHPLDLSEVLRQTLALRQFDWSHNAIEVTDDLHSVPPIVANKEEMQHVFLTLLRNAEEALVASAKERRIILRCSYDAASERVRVDIADNGAGVPPEAESRIFEPLFTLKPKGKGTGLGLNIARRIIEGHGGKIWLRSKEGTGTTVSIELPRQ
jgi:signal transduction histidine kinase